ncbi:MAG TPA: hypothetical protein VGM65_04995 [Candidatus Udaeobacter sp.]|jgi:hypothetical protein
MNAVTRYAGVAIAICSWIAISNHCALAAVVSGMHKAQTECPFHSKPAKQKKQSSQLECCKVLRAVVSAQSKVWARDNANFSDAVLCIKENAPFASSFPTLVPLLLDTGPPGARSFAELILQRSLLAHAPPVLA